MAQSTGGCSSVLSVKASPAPDHNNGISDLKEGVCKDSALQEVDQSYVGKGSDQADDESREYRSRDKDKPGRIAACGLREKIAQNVETSGSDSSDTRGKNFIDQIDDVQDDEKAGNIKFAEQQRRKRKRTIMNDRQTGMMEEVLKDKPDMQRHRDELQLWADRLSEHVCIISLSLSLSLSFSLSLSLYIYIYAYIYVCICIHIYDFLNILG